ncbi:MAG: DNA gyrase inhibitor YacG [Methylococcaceae bacterium]|nr:DNA gyrase inhibitor YacG [Methylococcaceae bacterium]
MSTSDKVKHMIVSCPTCQGQVVWDSLQKYRPFCSERCKLIDLGEWAADEKIIPGEPVYLDSEID